MVERPLRVGLHIAEQVSETIENLGLERTQDISELGHVGPAPLGESTNTKMPNLPPVEGFPNYFHTGNPETDQRIQGKVYKAMDSIVKRLGVPYVNPETGEISRKGFFEELERQIKAQDPDAKVYISGGVVRSLLGYIYRKIHAEHLKRRSQGVSAEDVLDRLIAGTPRVRNKSEVSGESSSDDEAEDLRPAGREIDVPTLSALGIGSDLDILVDFSAGFMGSRGTVLQKTTDFINSAGSQLGLENSSRTPLQNSLVPLGDIHEYADQTARTIEQGGSSLDWLAFPVTSRIGTQMRMPEGHLDIMDNFFRGEVAYLGEQRAGSRTAAEATTIRGLRSLLEIPFLKLTQGSEIQLVRELTDLRDYLKSGGTLDSRALKQFGKLVRNARFQGASNRFAKPKPGDRIAELVNEISSRSGAGKKGIPLIPEFSRNQKIAGRQVKDHSIDTQLMPLEQFLRENTDKGILYHGTPEMEYMLAMIRGGVIPSIPEKQGAAAYGSGFYTASNRLTSVGYAGTQGAVLELQVNQSSGLRVLSYQNFKSTPQGQAAIKAAHAMGKEINEYLAEKYELDIIINEYPLVMNIAAIKMPRRVEELIKAKLRTYTKLADLLHLAPNKVSEYLAFQNLGKLIGLREIGLDWQEHTKEFIKCLKGENHIERKNAIILLGKIKPTDPEILGEIMVHLGDFNKDMRHAAIEALVAIKPTDPEVLEQLAAYLSNSDKDMRSVAAKVLGEIKPTDPKIHNKIAECLRDPDVDVRQAAVGALGEIKPTDLKIHNEIAACLTDPDSMMRMLTAQALGEIKPTDPKIHEKIVACLNDPHDYVRQDIVRALGRIKPTDPEVLERIVAYLTDPKEAAPILALGVIKPADPKIHKKIAACLSSPDWGVRNAAARALGLVGLGGIEPTDPEVLGQIVAYLSNSDKDVRNAAAKVLSEIRPTDPKIHNEIAACLSDPDAYVRQAAINVLGEIRPKDKNIHNEIAACLSDPDVRVVRNAAIEALCKIKPADSEIHKKIAVYLSGSDTFLRSIVIRAFGQIKPTDSEIHKKIVACLGHWGWEIRRSAIEALVAIKPTDPEVLKQLVAYLGDSDKDVRSAAVQVLAAIKPTDPEVLEQLAAYLGDSNKDVRSAAAKALGEIKPTDLKIHNEIAACLNDPDVYVRQAAVGALGEIKPTDLKIHNEIAACLTDPDSMMRMLTAQALGKIKPTDPKIHEKIVACLNDSDVYVHMNIVWALDEIKRSKNS